MNVKQQGDSMLKQLIISAIFCFLWLGQGSTFARPNENLQIYIARDESAKDVLSHLLGLYGRALAGNENILRRPVSGKFEVRSVNDVMGYFEAGFRLNWFEYGSSIYLYSPSDWRSEKIYVGEYDASVDWTELLGKAGLRNSKFNVFYSSKTQELVASGPSDYLRLLKRTFEQDRPEPEQKVEEELVLDEATGQMVEKSKLQKPPPKPEFMVYPLKYTSVTDRKFKLREEEVVMPGILTILSQILAGGGNLGTATVSNAGEDKYGLRGIKLSKLVHPKTAVQAAGEVVRNTIRGTEPKTSELFPNGVPSLGPDRDVNAIGSTLDEVADGTSGAAGQPQGSIFADSRTNSLIIYDIPERFPHYKSILEQLDVPISMIEVEALLVELDSSTLNQLGMEFNLNQGSIQYDFPAAAVGGSSVVNPQEFVARIRALATDRRAKVLARPTIVTQDNVTAFIDLSETLFLQIQGERVAEVEKVTAGSLLQVTPRLLRNEDGQDEIFMRVEIQDGTLQRQNGQDTNPTVRNTSLSTQALIGQNKAILIGGYNRESQTEVDHKIPVLGSLPLVGKVFSSKETVVQNTSRLFLIIPKVLSKPENFAKSTRDALDALDKNFQYESNALEVPESVNLDKSDSNKVVE